MRKLINLSDKAAITLSITCALHCILLPIILIILPSVSGYLIFDDSHFHVWILYAVIPISIFAISLGYHHHRDSLTFIISAIGMSILIFGALFAHDLIGHEGEVAVTLLGSILIAISHLRNLRFRRSSKCE